MRVPTRGTANLMLSLSLMWFVPITNGLRLSGSKDGIERGAPS